MSNWTAVSLLMSTIIALLSCYHPISHFNRKCIKETFFSPDIFFYCHCFLLSPHLLDFSSFLWAKLGQFCNTKAAGLRHRSQRFCHFAQAKKPKASLSEVPPHFVALYLNCSSERLGIKLLRRSQKIPEIWKLCVCLTEPQRYGAL